MNKYSRRRWKKIYDRIPFSAFKFTGNCQGQGYVQRGVMGRATIDTQQWWKQPKVCLKKEM